jgi:hypothetical protein
MLSFTISPQESAKGPAVSAANPEMERLAKALVGDWDTVEVMERGQLFPTGGSRTGRVHARLASGEYTLVYEVHSDGSVGKLDGFLTIWWDPSDHNYSFFACFNDPESPCRMRGTAHWEGNSFVNDYDVTSDGKKTRWRDTFTFTPNSHTLVAAIDSGNGTMKTVITTTARRAHKRQASAGSPGVRLEMPGRRLS